MSEFIVPLSSLPTVTSITDKPQQAAKTTAEGLPFAGFLEDAMQNMVQTNVNSTASMYDLAVGGSDDLHSGAIDSLKYSTAVSFTSGVVSSVVRAYNELIRMQI